MPKVDIACIAGENRDTQARDWRMVSSKLTSGWLEECLETQPHLIPKVFVARTERLFRFA